MSEKAYVRHVWAKFGNVQGLRCAKMSLCVAFGQFRDFRRAKMLIFQWKYVRFRNYAIRLNVTAFKSSEQHNGILIFVNLASICLSRNGEIPCEILIFVWSSRLMILKMLIFRCTCDQRPGSESGGLESGGLESGATRVSGHRLRILDLAPYIPVLKKNYTGPYFRKLPLFREKP